MSWYSYDKTIIIGKVGRDAEMRYLPNGTAVTSFSVAVDRSFKRDGENVKRTIWYRVQAFGKLAEVCQSVSKGDSIFVDGVLEADWDTGSPRIFSKQDGGSGSSFDLTAKEIRFLSPKAKQEKQADTEEPF